MSILLGYLSSEDHNSTKAKVVSLDLFPSITESDESLLMFNIAKYKEEFSQIEIPYPALEQHCPIT